MRAFRFPSAVSVALLLSLILLGSGVRAFSLRSAVLRVAKSEELEDTCQCDCCYSVGEEDVTECVLPMDTSFSTPRCSGCSVEACAEAFPVSCGQQSSVVSTACMKRQGWMLQVVPVFFIVASVVLLLYGLFFKTYDGYHDDSRPAPPVTEVPPPGKIAGFGTFPNSYGIAREGERQNLIARATSKLPPISEDAEVVVEEEVMRDVEAGSTSVTDFVVEKGKTDNVVAERRE